MTKIISVKKLGHPLEAEQALECGHVQTVCGLGSRLKPGDDMWCRICDWREFTPSTQPKP